MRKVIIASLLALSTCLLSNAQSVELNNLKGREAKVSQGHSWGVPFAKGEVKADAVFTLKADGQPVQSSNVVLASWPDGSVKWLGMSAVAEPGMDQMVLEVAAAPKKKKTTKPVVDTHMTMLTPVSGGVMVNTGVMECFFPSSGNSIIRNMSIGGKVISSDARLVAVLETKDGRNLRYEDFESKVESVSVSRDDHMKAVVKIEGKHKSVTGSREWLPFKIFCTLYRDMPTITITHSFLFDSDGREDFIKGLGLSFDVPFREEDHNRHVRFAGDGKDGAGFWCQPVRLAPGYRPSAGRVFVDNYQDYLRGAKLPDKAQLKESERNALLTCPVWGDMRIVQNNPNSYSVDKRTNPESSWVHVVDGGRSLGGALLGDSSGSIFVGIKDFWQSYPATLQVDGGGKDVGRLTAWLWSPDGQSMDMRHYDTEGHDLKINYEDYKEGWESPYGVGHRSTIEVRLFDNIPQNAELLEVAKAVQKPVQFSCTPEYFHDVEAFGNYWGLPDRSNPVMAQIENQLDEMLEFYKDQVEQRSWYGFWNYGDVMHSYSTARHTWNYDHGGRAWHNTELETDLWLWFGFIRSGRADFYRMATAMTRHTSEVDSYHIGRMKGLGTRHNVTHWGCGAKEARVGQAWWKRYYYYLTTDDRLGDLMRESLDADYALLEFDPLVRAQPRSQFPTEQPTRLRWGPDWTSLVGNWFTEWERTGEQKWLDKINAGMNSLCDLPNGLFTGKGPYGYNPETGVLTYEGDPEWVDNRNHLANLQSSVEIMLEVLDGVDNKKFTETYLDYASWYGVPKDDPIRELPENARYKNWHGNWNIQRLTAIAANRRDNEHLKDIAWDRFLYGIVDKDGKTIDRLSMNKVGGTDSIVEAVEDGRVSSNDTAQWNLEAIIMMELLKDSIPELKDIRPYTPPVWPRN